MEGTNCKNSLPPGVFVLQARTATLASLRQPRKHWKPLTTQREDLTKPKSFPLDLSIILFLPKTLPNMNGETNGKLAELDEETLNSGAEG